MRCKTSWFPVQLVGGVRPAAVDH